LLIFLYYYITFNYPIFCNHWSTSECNNVFLISRRSSNYRYLSRDSISKRLSSSPWFPSLRDIDGSKAEYYRYLWYTLHDDPPLFLYVPQMAAFRWSPIEANSVQNAAQQYLIIIFNDIESPAALRECSCPEVERGIRSHAS